MVCICTAGAIGFDIGAAALPWLRHKPRRRLVVAALALGLGCRSLSGVQCDGPARRGPKHDVAAGLVLEA